MGLLDSLGSMGQNLGRSLTGNAVKAVLLVRDPSKIAESSTNKDDVKSKTDAMWNDAKDLDNDLLKETKKRLIKNQSVMTASDIKDKATGKGYLTFEVQYNPSSLRMSSSAGLQYDRSGEGSQTQAQEHETPSSTTLSCELLFDDTNIQDAFMIENNPVTNMSVGNVYSAVKSAVKGDFSVKNKVEGFISLFAVSEAKQVIFFWGNMSFGGEMTGAEARYTMFNKKGNPIRASVNISIRQGRQGVGAEGEQNKQDYYQVQNEYWEWAFDRAFGVLDMSQGIEGMKGKAGVNNETKGQSGLDSVLNNNFLNLKL